MLKNKSTRILYDREGKEGLPDGIISTHDVDEDDNDADDGGATKLLPHVYSFFGSASQAPADDAEWELPVATPASHAPSHATAPSSIGATSVSTSASGSVSGCGSTRAPDATLTLQIAEAVAEAIRRTEAIAAARYERALISFGPSSPHSRQESRRRRERGVRGWGLGECRGPSLTHRFVTDRTRRLKSSSPKEEAEL